MKSLNEIREDLKEIRYYYSRKKMFDEASRLVGANSVMQKVNRYSDAVQGAEPRLYDMYINLYVKGFTQEGLAAEMNYSPDYIHLLNKRLILFLQKTITD